MILINPFRFGGLKTTLPFPFTDNSDQETSFEVLGRKTLVGGAYSVYKTLPVNAPTAPSLVSPNTISNLDFNTSYDLEVIAKRTGFPDSSVYGPVALTTATLAGVTNLTAASASVSQINLAWTNPAVQPLTGYRITGALSGLPKVFIADVSPGVTTYSATGLTSSETYAFDVSPVNDNPSPYEDALGPVATATAKTRATPTTIAINSAGTQLVITYNEAIGIGAGGNGGMALTLSGGAVTATYLSGTGTSSHTYTLSRTIGFIEAGTAAYTQPGNGLEDAFGGDVPTYSGRTVTNNSTFGYELEERFEETNSGGALGSSTDGFDSPLVTLVSTGTGTVNRDDTTATVLAGAQQLRVTGVSGENTNYVEWTLAADRDDYWICIKIKGTIPANRDFIRVTNLAGTTTFAVSISAASKVQIAAGVVTSSPIIANTYTPPQWIWIHATRSGALKVYQSATGIRPADGSADMATGTLGNQTMRKVRVGLWNTTATLYFDNLIGNIPAIGDNP